MSYESKKREKRRVARRRSERAREDGVIRAVVLSLLGTALNFAAIACKKERAAAAAPKDAA